MIDIVSLEDVLTGIVDLRLGVGHCDEIRTPFEHDLPIQLGNRDLRWRGSRRNLEECVKGIVIGILKGSKSMGEEAFSTITDLAGKIIKTTVDTGADVVKSTTGLLKGVIHSAKDMGADAEKAVSAAATGAESGPVPASIGSAVPPARTASPGAR